jgi:hypothetical protein
MKNNDKKTGIPQSLKTAVSDSTGMRCTQCESIKKYHNELVYSQGNLVCTDCKEENKVDDNRAYDRFITSR